MGYNTSISTNFNAIKKFFGSYLKPCEIWYLAFRNLVFFCRPLLISITWQKEQFCVSVSYIEFFAGNLVLESPLDISSCSRFTCWIQRTFLFLSLTVARMQFSAKQTLCVHTKLHRWATKAWQHHASGEFWPQIFHKCFIIGPHKVTRAKHFWPRDVRPRSIKFENCSCSSCSCSSCSCSGMFVKSWIIHYKSW